MKKNHNFRVGLILAFFNVALCGTAFAATGSANDGQFLLLTIMTVLSVIAGILYFFPKLVHKIGDLWKKYHHC
jgi:hypothetical protein